MWACRVINASSEYYEKDAEYPELQKHQFSFEQVLGKPNVYPASGLNPNAWTTHGAKQDEFIHVEFCDTVKVRQIILVETLNPGSVHKITGYDLAGKEFNLGTYTAVNTPYASRIQNIFIERTAVAFKSIKVHLNAAVAGGQVGIDAIGISDSDIPFTLKLDIPKELNPKLSSSPLSVNVNSSLRELNPVMTPDQKLLFFSRAFDKGNRGGESDPEDIWVARRDTITHVWQPAEHMDSVLNTFGPNFVSSIHAKGDTLMFLTGNKYKKNKVTAGLTLFKFSHDNWSEPIDVDVEDFYNYSSEGNFFISPDHSVIILSVMRDDTQGDRDLYVSFKAGNRWTQPKNLGPQINSAGVEATPYLMSDTKTLFFSSNGHSGLGGADIFVSKRLDDSWQQWSAPQNLGPKLNSEHDEFGLTLYSDKVYFIRGNRENTDVWEMVGRLFVKKYDSLLVNIKTMTDLGELLPDCRIRVVPFTIKDMATDSSANLDVNLDPETKYSITAEHKGYEKTSIDTLFSENDSLANVVLKLKPIEKAFKELMDVEIVYFDFDKNDIKPQFFAYLDRVGQYIIDQNLKVELYGHTDAMGTNQYNDTLSIKRSTAIREYLLKKGVKESQISIFGFGEVRPAMSNTQEDGKDNPDGRKMNRRVEFRLLGIAEE